MHPTIYHGRPMEAREAQVNADDAEDFVLTVVYILIALAAIALAVNAIRLIV